MLEIFEIGSLELIWRFRAPKPHDDPTMTLSHIRVLLVLSPTAFKSHVPCLFHKRFDQSAEAVQLAFGIASVTSGPQVIESLNVTKCSLKPRNLTQKSRHVERDRHRLP